MQSPLTHSLTPSLTDHEKQEPLTEHNNIVMKIGNSLLLGLDRPLKNGFKEFSWVYDLNNLII